MENQTNIRYGWLKGMYIANVIVASLLGLGMVLMPETYASMNKLPTQDPIMFGMMGSVALAFGLVSILGLKFPLKFAPILLLQMTYKSIWFLGVIIPLVLKGQLPQYALTSIILFAAIIIGDAIAIPFKYLFKKQLTE